MLIKKLLKKARREQTQSKSLEERNLHLKIPATGPVLH